MRKYYLGLIAFGFLELHFVLAATIPLIEDEAYYLLWTEKLSWGYYDHPPMIAWWIATGKALLGATPLGVRLLPVLTSVLLTLLTYRITSIATRDQSSALFAAFWVNCMTLVTMLSFAATPDAPSLLFWTISFWGLVELSNSKNPNWWFVVGIFAGLGVQTKFTNLFFGLALVIWLLGSKEGRSWLFRWHVWGAGILALIIMSPLIFWNYNHDWIGLERQFGRLDVEKTFQPLNILEMVLTQLLLISPIVCVLALTRLRTTVQKFPLVVWIAAPIVLYMVYHATHSKIAPNWLLPIYPMIAVMAAFSETKIWLKLMAGTVGLALTALVLILAGLPGKPIIPGHNPFNQAKGWDDFSKEVIEVADKHDVEWIATLEYGLTGHLAYHLAPNLPVWQINEPERYIFRGFIPEELCNSSTLFLLREGRDQTVPFENIESIGTLSRNSEGIALITYDAYIASKPIEALAPACQQN